MIQPPAKKEGVHSFSGACAPTERPKSLNCLTFSVGIFEWVPTTKGLKKSPVKVRVSGPMAEPDLVYAKALEIAEALNAGVYNGPKNVKV